ncbi:MAG: selenocysteine-specific translation elongation factor, partial [Planctomycetota bacterium]
MKTDSAQIFNVIVGTSGHIDHGKSSLVRKLTGIDPDRLPEEKERGMTIDLGFAPCFLKNGQKVGIIDVPGHERFVKNMVAGATSIDFVMLVVAADDGVMPQTREHLSIMKLLGVRRGMVVVTKVDMVDKDMVELVVEDVKDLVKGSFLEGTPICPISVVTGDGWEPFWEELNRQIAALPTKNVEGVFRMPIQRVFSAKGFGTIVTGVPISGRVAIGDTLEILPHERKGRIRGLQAYHNDVEEIKAGHSSAINIADVRPENVVRGNVVVTPGYFRPGTMVNARFKYLAESHGPLKDQMPVRLHVGTAEILGTVVLLDRKEYAPGDEGFVQIRLEELVVCAPGDAYVLRIQSPMITIGGGRVVSLGNEKLRRMRPEVTEALAEEEKSLPDPKAWVEFLVKQGLTEPITPQAIDVATALTRPHVDAALAALKAAGSVVVLPDGDRLLHRAGVDAAIEKLRQCLSRFHNENLLRVGPDKHGLRNVAGLDPQVFELGLEEGLKQKRVAEENGLYRLPERQMKLSSEVQKLAGRIEAILKETRFVTPRPDE